MQLRSADEGSTVFYEVSSWQGTFDLSLYMNWRAVSRMRLQILSEQLVFTSRHCCHISSHCMYHTVSPPSGWLDITFLLLSSPPISSVLAFVAPYRNWQSSSMLNSSIASNIHDPSGLIWPLLIRSLSIFFFHLLPFLLHPSLFSFPSLENNSNRKNDHPANHPREINTKVLT